MALYEHVTPRTTWELYKSAFSWRTKCSLNVPISRVIAIQPGRQWYRIIFNDHGVDIDPQNSCSCYYIHAHVVVISDVSLWLMKITYERYNGPNFKCRYKQCVNISDVIISGFYCIFWSVLIVQDCYKLVHFLTSKSIKKFPLKPRHKNKHVSVTIEEQCWL